MEYNKMTFLPCVSVPVTALANTINYGININKIRRYHFTHLPPNKRNTKSRQEPCPKNNLKNII